MLNCAPAIASLEASGSEITALRVTSSPGLALTLSRIHEISPAAPTIIAPSVSVTLSVILFPLVSQMKALDHSTGYTPAAQSVGTVYTKVKTVEPSSALTPLPMPSPNANCFVSTLYTNFEPYASEPEEDFNETGALALILN